MKNQFIKVHDFRGKDNVPGHIAAMNGWVSTSANTGGSGNHHSTLIVDQDAVEQWALVFVRFLCIPKEHQIESDER